MEARPMSTQALIKAARSSPLSLPCSQSKRRPGEGLLPTAMAQACRCDVEPARRVLDSAAKKLPGARRAPFGQSLQPPRPPRVVTLCLWIRKSFWPLLKPIALCLTRFCARARCIWPTVRFRSWSIIPEFWTLTSKEGKQKGIS